MPKFLYSMVKTFTNTSNALVPSRLQTPFGARHESTSYIESWAHSVVIVCPLEPHIALVLGICMHYIPLSCTSSPCNLLFLNLGIQLFSQVPPVSMWMPQ